MGPFEHVQDVGAGFLAAEELDEEVEFIFVYFSIVIDVDDSQDRNNLGVPRLDFALLEEGLQVVEVELSGVLGIDLPEQVGLGEDQVRLRVLHDLAQKLACFGEESGERVLYFGGQQIPLLHLIVVPLRGGKTDFGVISAESHLEVVLEVQTALESRVEQAYDQRDGHVVSLEAVDLHKVVYIGGRDRGAPAFRQAEIARVRLKGIDRIEDLPNYLEVPVPL